MFYKIFLFLICGNILSLFTSIALINVTSVLLLLSIFAYLIKYPISFNILRQLVSNNKIVVSSLLFLPIYIFIHQLYFTQSIVQAFKTLVEWRTLLYGSIFILPFLFYQYLINSVGKFFIIISSIFIITGLSYFIFTGKPFNQEVYKHAPYLSSQILVTCIFLCFQLALNNFKGKLKYILYIIGILASIMLFFATSRRTGYIIYTVSFIVFILINFKVIFNIKSIRYKIIGLCVVPLILFILYLAPTTQNRIKEAFQEKQMYKQGNFETSNGLRLRFWNISSKIIEDSPIFGVGFTNYAAKFKETESKFDGYNIKEHFVHPHNEFIHVWSCFGIIAFLDYIYILLFPLIYYIRMNNKLSYSNYNNMNGINSINNNILPSIHKVLIIAYISSIIGTLFNAMAIDMIEGHFLSLILAGYYSLYINTKNK